MARNHILRPQDCLASLAEEAGLNADSLWNLPENARLRDQRPVPLHLCKGDSLFVPDVDAKDVPIATGRRHVFRRIGVPATYRARIQRHDGSPRANESFHATVDGVPLRGFTDSDGAFAIHVPCAAKKIVLVLDLDQVEATFELGHLAPRDSLEGARMRLQNLGYHLGDKPQDLDASCRLAFAAYQAHAGLPVTEDDDKATRAALADTHDHLG